MHSTRIVSHRGANGVAPENTFAAADKAIELGADYIELDVRESADGVLYVHHDATLDRTTDGSGPIGETPSSVIDRLDAGSWFSPDFAGQRVPRLDAYLEHLRQRAGVYIELKWCDPSKVVRLVRDLRMVDETFYFSFSPQMRESLAAEAPEFRKMITLTIAGSPSLAKPLFGASILEFSVNQATREVLDACARLKLETMVYYGGDDPAVFETVALMGVDYINLDRPELFRAAAQRVSVKRASE